MSFVVAQLSGIALDADCPAGMHAAFERLKRRGHMACVRNVVSLRATRWGMAEPEVLPLHDVHGAPGAQPPPPDPRRRVVTGEAHSFNSVPGAVIWKCTCDPVRAQRSDGPPYSLYNY